MLPRNAVISQRNGELVLMFRIGNMRSSHLLQAQVRAQMVHKVVTDEGENINFYQQELAVNLLYCILYSQRRDHLQGGDSAGR